MVKWIVIQVKSEQVLINKYFEISINADRKQKKLMNCLKQFLFMTYPIRLELKYTLTY